MEVKKAKKAKTKPKKFEYLADQFKKRHLPTLKESTRKTYTERINQEMVPVFGNMYIKDITRSDIIELLEEIAFDRGSPYQSNRVRAILSSMFNFGVRREIAEYNPVKLTQPMGKESKRKRVLNEDEIKKLWKGSDTLQEPASSLLKVLLLLGQRLGETRRMKWSDIQDRIWTIPVHETKANRLHEVPLSALAIEIIFGLENDSEFVFRSKYGGPIQSMYSSFYRLTKGTTIEDIRIHDLRRTAATYMAELGTDRTVLGKVLNHKGLAGDSQVTARYDRHGYMNEKRTAIEGWERKLKDVLNH